MNQNQVAHFRARMSIAQLFRSALNNGDERAKLMQRLGVDTMPVIVPALEDTRVLDIREAASRYLSKGDEHVIVPVGFLVKDKQEIHISVLTISKGHASNFWQLSMEDLHDQIDMGQVVAALDPDKRWDIGEIDDQAFRDLATFI